MSRPISLAAACGTIDSRWRIRRLCLWLVSFLTLFGANLLAQSGVGSSRPNRGADPDWHAGGRRDLPRPATRPSNQELAVTEEELGGDEGQGSNSSDRNRAPGGLVGAKVTDAIEGAAGQLWREYNLAPYTSRMTDCAHPEQAVVDWIFKQTGPETWHGEDVAVLSATRGKLRVYHRPEVQARVATIVERFTRQVQPQVSIRVQLAVAPDLNWRNGMAHLLRPVALGPDGQQVWLMAPEDASLLRSRLRLDRVAGPTGQHLMLRNGQPAQFEAGKEVNYISSLELEGGSYLSYQPVIGKLHEGVQAKFMALWTLDGNAVDLEVELTTRLVQRLHSSQGLAPLSTGTQEAVLQVPETVASSMIQNLRWPISQVLVISAGVQPSRSAARRGPLAISPSVGEMLILAEIDPPFSTRIGTRRDGPK